TPPSAHLQARLLSLVVRRRRLRVGSTVLRPHFHNGIRDRRARWFLPFFADGQELQGKGESGLVRFGAEGKGMARDEELNSEEKLLADLAKGWATVHESFGRLIEMWRGRLV